MSLLELFVPRLDITWPREGEGLRLIVVPGAGAASLGYDLAPGQTIGLEAISADVSTAGLAAEPTISASLTDSSGLLIAKVQTVATMDTGVTGQVTFAPSLIDTGSLGSPASGVNLQAGLWTAAATGGSTITVEVSDAAARVTELRLWAFDAEAIAGTVRIPAGLLAYLPVGQT